MVNQWAGAAHRFEIQLQAAETKMAMFAIETFRKSFDLKRFNSQGAPAWRPLKGKAKPTHVSLLYETGALKDSITSKRTTRSKIGSKITIFTDPVVFNRENRNPKGKCFASIHNSGGSIEASWRSKARYILQRQFMPTKKGEQTSGDSSYMIDMFQKLHIELFYGLPK